LTPVDKLIISSIVLEEYLDRAIVLYEYFFWKGWRRLFADNLHQKNKTSAEE